MSPEDLLRSLAKQSPAPVYLFAGPESYRRDACRRALLDKALPPDDRDEGFTRHDLDEVSLSDVLDDARAMSLFASARLIWVSSSESALPRGRAAAAAASDDEAAAPKSASSEELEAYCADPTPGVTLVFDAHKWDFDGDDKPKMERLRKFFSPVRATVEFTRFSTQEARELARSLASARSLKIATPELELLVETANHDASRIATEIEKLACFATPGTAVTAADITALVPDAHETTVFNLVNALARRDRIQSMELLDTLVRAGEYLPLALTFLAGVFRMALAAREQNLRSANDVQSYFQRQGVPMWRSRAEQISLAASRFPKDKLEQAIQAVFKADRDLKSARPDDRLVMENFVLRLTA